ncbi:MAG: c-type cytochrome [Halarcobacter sp.]
MKKLVSICLLASCIVYADPYARCVGCHGVNGEKSAINGKSKIIKDMTKAEIKAAMLGYKDGTYGREMKGMMKGQSMSLSNSDIEAIANRIGK